MIKDIIYVTFSSFAKTNLIWSQTMKISPFLVTCCALRFLRVGDEGGIVVVFNWSMNSVKAATFDCVELYKIVFP